MSERPIEWDLICTIDWEWIDHIMAAAAAKRAQENQ